MRSNLFHRLSNEAACLLSDKNSIFKYSGEFHASSKEFNFHEYASPYPILPTALARGFYSASNRNEYQNQKKVSGEQRAVGA
jgi:hypothetical protein